MSTNTPELPAGLFAQLWIEALKRHPDVSVHPGVASVEVARLAYAAGREARVAEESSVAEAPDAALVARVGRIVQPPADVENAVEWLRYLADLFRATERNQPAATALDRAASMLEQFATKARWSAALFAAPSDGPAVPEGREPAAVAKEPSDEELLQTYGAAKRDYNYDTVAGLRAVLAGWGRPVPPPAEGEAGELVELVGIAAGVCAHEGYHDEAQACRTAAALLQQQAGPVPADQFPGATEKELQEARREVSTFPPEVVADRLRNLGKVQARQGREYSAALCERAAELAELKRLRLVPVPVSERPWERDDWVLDPDGECWWCPPDEPAWLMANPSLVGEGWLLPFFALPLPSGEAADG